MKRERKEAVEDVESLDKLKTVGVHPFTAYLVAINSTTTMFKLSIENKNHVVFKYFELCSSYLNSYPLFKRKLCIFCIENTYCLTKCLLSYFQSQLGFYADLFEWETNIYHQEFITLFTSPASLLFISILLV